MKILLVSYHFPPVMNVGGMRALSWSKYWSEKGIDITVIAGKKSDFKGNASKIITDVPNNVKVFYIESLYSQIQNEVVDKTRKISFKNKLVKLIKYHAPIADFDFTFVKAAKKQLNALRQQGEKFDYIVSTASPTSAHIIGLYAKKVFNCRFVADFRDLREQSVDSPVFGLLRENAIKRLEKRIIKKADILTTVSEDLNNILSQKVKWANSNAKNICIYNGYFEEMFENNTIQEKLLDWQIIYTGTFYEKQFDITPLFNALSKILIEKEIPCPKLIFIGEERNFIKDKLTKLATQYNVNDIEFRDAVSLEEAISIQLRSSFLLLLDGMNNKGVLKTKSYEYLAARCPIIAIVNPKGELAQKFLNGYRGYVVGDDSGKIKTFIEEIYWIGKETVDFHQVEGFFVPLPLIEQFSRRNQAIRLLEYMEQPTKSN